MSDVEANYLLDIGTELRARWLEAEADLRSASPGNAEFHRGVCRAYREVLNLLLLQANAFGIPAGALGLGGIDTSRDLGC